MDRDFLKRHSIATIIHSSSGTRTLVQFFPYSIQYQKLQIYLFSPGASMKKGVAMLLGLLIICAMSEAQNLKNENKIDPAFRQLINNEKVKSTFGNKSSSKTKTSISKEKVSEKQPKRVMYECTVYTKDAKALKDKGIIINSALPTFVTATVSLDQIELMSAMNVVTYIEAAKTIYPTQRNVNATPSKH